MAPRTAEEPLSTITQHLVYIGPVPARTGRPNGYRNRSNEVGGAAQPRLPLTPFRTQIKKLLELGVIKELQASIYRRWSMAIDSRLAQLYAVTQVPDGWLEQVFERLRATNIAVNPKQTKLGLPEVEYVGHLVSATGTSFTPEKRLKVLDFPQPATQKEMPLFIGLANYFRDHDRQLRSVQALPTSYIELSGTLLPRGHCHTYPLHGN
jgi:hypothetical protein